MLPISDDTRRERRRFPFVTILLLLVNVGVFVYMVTLSQGELEAFVASYAVIPAEIVGARPGGGEPLWLAYLPLLTSLFIHGGLLHLFGNMLFLWIFGDNVEASVGHFTFLALYVTAGILGSLAHILFFADSTTPTIGASGAIAGVLGSYLLLHPRAHVRVLLFFGPFITLGRVAAVFLIFGWFVLQVLRGTVSLFPQIVEAEGGVAYLAHVGGFIAGVILTASIRSLRGQQVTSLEGEFYWTDSVRNWVLVVLLVGGALAFSSYVGGTQGAAIQLFILLAAAVIGLVDGIVRAVGRAALLGPGKGAGRYLAVLQVMAALTILGLLFA